MYQGERKGVWGGGGGGAGRGGAGRCGLYQLVCTKVLILVAVGRWGE